MIMEFIKTNPGQAFTAGLVIGTIFAFLLIKICRAVYNLLEAGSIAGDVIEKAKSVSRQYESMNDKKYQFDKSMDEMKKIQYYFDRSNQLEEKIASQGREIEKLNNELQRVKRS